MKKYYILFSIGKCGRVEIEAKNEKETKKKFRNGNFNDSKIKKSESEINFEDLEVEEIK